MSALALVSPGPVHRGSCGSSNWCVITFRLLHVANAL